MTAQEFFYWLQGFIELCNAGAIKFVIGPDIATCILAHIDLVPEGERGEGLIEVRTLVRLAKKTQSEAHAMEYTRDIVFAVANVFLHVIDPKAGDAEAQVKLDAIHSQNPHLRPGFTMPGGRVARC